MNRTITAVVACAVLLAAPACGDSEGQVAADGTSNTTATTTSTSGSSDDLDGGQHGGEHEDAAVTIDGRDYAFDEVPAKVAAGTALALTNSSTVELHELVAFRLPDDVDTPLADLLAQPADELGAVLGAPVTVILRPPGSDDQIVAVGDGVLREPGRYALLCFIPLGADPQEYLAAAAASNGEAPQGVAGGPPHFTAGMSAELVVVP